MLAVNGLFHEKMIRATDAKEVGVGNPAEETYRYPNQIIVVKIEIFQEMSTYLIALKRRTPGGTSSAENGVGRCW